MGLIIAANNVKFFAKALHCLYRLGQDIYLEFDEREILVKTLDASRSTFASLAFQRSFFQEFSQFDVDEGEYLSCKVPVKTFLQVFRSPSVIEKTVETCELKQSEDGEHLIFVLHCKHLIVKTFQVKYEECAALKAIYSKDLTPNKLTASSKLLLDVIANFPTSVEDITLTVTPCCITITSYSDQKGTGNTMSTEISLNPKEFSYFQVGVDSSVSFSLKNLRPILAFAESCDCECKLSFEHGGKPLVLELSQDSMFSANFVLATIGSDQNQVGPSVVREKPANHNNTTLTSVLSTGREQNTPTVQKLAKVNNCEKMKSQYARVSDIIFDSMQLSQGTAKTVLAPDSDEESN